MELALIGRHGDGGGSIIVVGCDLMKVVRTGTLQSCTILKRFKKGMIAS